jgi:hypothetical protein
VSKLKTGYNIKAYSSRPVDSIIGSRMHCSGCRLEEMKLIDQNGITHSEFKQWKYTQVCNNCKSGNLLEFLPIKKGEKLIDVTNKMCKESWKQSQDQIERKLSKPKEIFEQRVVIDEVFAEAVLIDKIPKFLVAKYGTGEISIQDSISLEKENKIVKPLPAEAYINKPYSFNSKLEYDAIVEEAKKHTSLDSIYKMVKPIWQKYVDADNFHISICSADTIFTYFQDKAGMTHYLFFVGGPGSGKSNNLEVFHFLAYRNMTSAGITPATLYRFYGGREEGVGTICEDEANDLDENEDKMRFYKNGYTTGKPIIRNDDTESGRIPRKYFTFGWKALAAERLPDSITAKGFMDRTIPMPCTYGYPEYDITEVSNPMGEQKFIELLQELENTRNILLIYRLLHHDSKFPDIPLNIIAREKQLFKPILRIFNGTETQKELEEVISNYINERRAANVDSQHAFVFRTVVDLIKEKDSHELTSRDIWDEIIKVPGEFMYKGNTKYQTVEYGTLSQKLVANICIQVLGAKPSRDKSKRKLVFNPDKLDRLGELFNLTLQVKVTDMTDMTDTGIAKYNSEGEGDKKNIENDVNNENNISDLIQNIENPIESGISMDPNHSENPSQVSYPSPSTLLDNHAGRDLPAYYSEGKYPVRGGTCGNCGEVLDPNEYWANIHRQNCTGLTTNVYNR